MPETIAFNGHLLASAFQPIYNVRDCRVEGYEALVRATAADGSPVRPSQLFEGLAEAETVSLDRTCRTLHLRNFSAIDPGNRMLYLNMEPAAALLDAGRAKNLRSRIGAFGLAPARVCIEILEGSCADEGLLAEAAAACREIGVHIAIDDFGVARSNFDRVAAIRPDYVKVDRSILADAVGDEKARRMLPSVIDILHEAGARIVIEGIETAPEAMVAIESGADYLQGHFFSIPRAFLHDDALTDAMLAELVRVRLHAPTRAEPHPAPAAAPMGRIACLLQSTLAPR